MTIVYFDADQVELSTKGSGNNNGPILDEGNYLVNVADLQVLEEERDEKKQLLQQQIMVEFQCGEGHFRQWYTVNHADRDFWRLDLGLRHMKQICVYSGCPHHKITDDLNSYTPILEGNQFAIGIRNLKDKATGSVRHKSLDNGKAVPMKVVQFIARAITDLPAVPKISSLAPETQDIMNKFNKTFQGSVLMSEKVPDGAPTAGNSTGTEEDVPF